MNFLSLFWPRLWDVVVPGCWLRRFWLSVPFPLWPFLIRLWVQHIYSKWRSVQSCLVSPQQRRILWLMPTGLNWRKPRCRPYWPPPIMPVTGSGWLSLVLGPCFWQPIWELRKATISMMPGNGPIWRWLLSCWSVLSPHCPFGSRRLTVCENTMCAVIISV